MVRWVHEHNIGASLASPRVSQSSLYLFPDHCPSCGRLGSEGMLGVTSSLGYATGQDDEPPDSSPQQRVGCTWLVLLPLNGHSQSCDGLHIADATPAEPCYLAPVIIACGFQCSSVHAVCERRENELERGTEGPPSK